jgi:hypothetical protein
MKDMNFKPTRDGCRSPLRLSASRWLLFFAAIVLLSFSCRQKKASQASNDPLASDRTVTMEFHPFWGGMAACELERKKGTDRLTYTYLLQRPLPGDSTWSKIADISKSQADSIFLQAEKVYWDGGINYGASGEPIGLMLFCAYKKGPATKTTSWERLKVVNELPAELLKLGEMLNALAPADMKLF